VINSTHGIGSPGRTVSVTGLAPTENRKNKDSSFADVFNSEIQKREGVKLSSHVQKRMKERNISLNKELAEKINTAFQKAEAKGARESLLLIDDLALIASIKNKTVVTALDAENAKDYVFTNIDSAVILK